MYGSLNMFAQNNRMRQLLSKRDDRVQQVLTDMSQTQQQAKELKDTFAKVTFSHGTLNRNRSGKIGESFFQGI